MSLADSGIKRICVSVSDLEKSLRFFVDEMELKVAARGSLDSAAVEALYQIKGSSAQYAMLENQVQPSLLQLIQFSGSSRKEIRRDRPSWDPGYYDIAFRAKDNTASLKHFKEKGYSYFCEPVRYVADWIDLDVLEGVMEGPDCIPIAMIERLKEPIPKFDGRFSIFTDTAVTLDDGEEATAFYEGVLGLKKIFDETLPDGLVDEVVSVPAGTHTRMLMFSGGNTPITECLVYSKIGRPMKDVAKPENLGIFAMAYERDDMEETLEKAAAAGHKTIAGPVELELLPYGRIRTALVEGPSGVTVEIFKIMKDQDLR